ncbi:MAG: endonuclease/exonuclease/phosphatase family protein [Flavobacteriaceae bacterium]|nr:endonuclease/exonuclease/phosphatase family protein [Flavobacteriaceae bacterium]
MKLFINISILLFYSLINAQIIGDLSFGTDDTFEIMTWNLETFPKNEQQTLDDVSKIVEALDVDFIAIQEINNQIAFQQMATNLVGYNGYIESTYYDGLAFLYKPDVVEIKNIYRIYSTSTYWNVFPRAPMVVNITYHNQDVTIINNHLKCCGDGILNLTNTDDEEYRRYEAINLLKSYIDNNLQNENVILLGDLNDELSDSISNNVFQNIIDDNLNYVFTDYNIALGSSSSWSYPSWPSHLDHILISNELFDELNSSNSDIQTIKIDNYLSGGWTEYNQNISDHRPVALKVAIDSNLGINDISKKNLVYFVNYPNPIHLETTFFFKTSQENCKIEICNSLGQITFSKAIPNGQSKLIWKTKNLSNGIYFAKLISNNQIIANRKLLISNNI